MASKGNFQKLYRSEHNKVIAGICGGLGEYFEIDPVILRILFVLITIFGGSGLIIYFVLWIVIPSKSQKSKTSEDYLKENVEEIKTKSEGLAKKGNGRVLGGVILVVLGLSLLFDNLGFYIFKDVWKFWPLALIAIGFTILTNKNNKTK